MKYRYMHFIVFAVICFFGLGSLAHPQNAEDGGFNLYLDSSKKSYKLGEIVAVSFKLKNEKEEILTFSDRFGVGSGLLSLHISKDGKSYQNYGHPGWGLIDLMNPPQITLTPGESVDASATVLWKWRGADKSEYAFPTAGEYFLKAQYIYGNVVVNGQTQPRIIDSKPLKITIDEPVGDDLAVWARIKSNADFASFMQEGDLPVPSYKDDERLKFQQEIEQILVDHPNSFYAAAMRQSLEKFRMSEARRQEALKKMQRPKP